MLTEVKMDSKLAAAAKDKLVELANLTTEQLGKDKPSNWQEVLAYYQKE